VEETSKLGHNTYTYMKISATFSHYIVRLLNMAMRLEAFTVNDYTISNEVDVEVRLVGESGSVIVGKEVTVLLCAVHADSNEPVKFLMKGESVFQEYFRLVIGVAGFVRRTVVCDASQRGEVKFHAILLDATNSSGSNAVKLVKYRIDIVEMRLTDDIGDYKGEGGIHYTNNSSARVKVVYRVLLEDGSLLTDVDELKAFHKEMTAQLLFASGSKLEYKDESGRMVAITQVECAVKRKSKDEVKIRACKDVFVERKDELSVKADGRVAVSFRLNIFSTHDILKKNGLDGRDNIIELGHPMALAVSTPRFRVLTKYHAPGKDKRKNCDRKSSGGGCGKRRREGGDGESCHSTTCFDNKIVKIESKDHSPYCINPSKSQPPFPIVKSAYMDTSKEVVDFMNAAKGVVEACLKSGNLVGKPKRVKSTISVRESFYLPAIIRKRRKLSEIMEVSSTNRSGYEHLDDSEVPFDYRLSPSMSHSRDLDTDLHWQSDFLSDWVEDTELEV
jgi:hypothetical protein